jgi:hypothetical protein
MKKLLERISTTLGSDGGRNAAEFPSRSNRVWNDQGELWNSGASKMVAPARTEPRTPAKAFDFSETEIVRKFPPQSDAAVANTPARRTAYGDQLRGARAQNIARFLEVNRTVQSGHGFAYRVIQAVRGASADYDLWKGPTKTVTFLLG